MLIRTSAPSRQLERMLGKRDWRRRLASRQDPAAVAAPHVNNVVSIVAAFEPLPVKRLHRPARSEQAVARTPVTSRSLQLQGLRGHFEEETPAPR